MQPRDLDLHGGDSGAGEAFSPRRGGPCFDALPLETAVAGREWTTPEHGPFYLITSGADAIDTIGALSHEFARALARGSWAGLSEVLPQDVIFADVESTGLGSAPLFLIGIMVWEDGVLALRQFLARGYAEEAGVVAAFADACASKKLLITFNGMSFDLPLIRTRAAANCVPFDLELAHLDLLHASRRVWRHRLPNYRLQTIEECLCNRVREDDIPGSEIPRAYEHYVSIRDARHLARIVRHNALDLITLAELMIRMPVE